MAKNWWDCIWTLGILALWIYFILCLKNYLFLEVSASVGQQATWGEESGGVCGPLSGPPCFTGLEVMENSPRKWPIILGLISTRLKLVLEKAEEPEIKLPTSTGSLKKQESSRKTCISALLTMPKPLTVITINCGKFWKRWEYQTTWPASWEICMQVRKQQLELDMEQQTGSK